MGCDCINGWYLNTDYIGPMIPCPRHGKRIEGPKPSKIDFIDVEYEIIEPLRLETGER